MSSQPSRALLIAAGVLTQLIGATCLVLALASLPVAYDLKAGLAGLLASIVAAVAAIVCGTLLWRGKLVPLALSTVLDIGFGVGVPRGGTALEALLHILPPAEIHTAETLITGAAIVMFAAAILCVLSLPVALKLRQWARAEIAAGNTDPGITLQGVAAGPTHHGVAGAEVVSLRKAASFREIVEPKRPSAGASQQKLMPTQVIRLDATPRGRALVIVGVALTVIALGAFVITAATGGGGKSDHVALASPAAAGSSHTLATVDAPPVIDAPPALPPLDEFIMRFHEALVNPSNLGLVFDSKVFAFGVDAHEVAEGRDDVVAQLRKDLGNGGAVTVKFSHVASAGDVAWIAEELRIGNKTFAISAAASVTEGAWTIGALHWAVPMPNDMAYRLARSGDLAIPDAIPDSHDQSQLATTMATAFSSKPAFVEARSTRPDAFNYGSAGERLKGGDIIKKLFARIHAELRLHDVVKVGTLGARGGWGVANIEYTDADRDGTEVTQTFRLLAVWLQEDAGWRIVLTHFSNAR